jgi:hypothetical protein
MYVDQITFEASPINSIAIFILYNKDTLKTTEQVFFILHHLQEMFNLKEVKNEMKKLTFDNSYCFFMF